MFDTFFQPTADQIPRSESNVRRQSHHITSARNREDIPGHNVVIPGEEHHKGKISTDQEASLSSKHKKAAGDPTGHDTATHTRDPTGHDTATHTRDLTGHDKLSRYMEFEDSSDNVLDLITEQTIEPEAPFVSDSDENETNSVDLRNTISHIIESRLQVDGDQEPCSSTKDTTAPFAMSSGVVQEPATRLCQDINHEGIHIRAIQTSSYKVNSTSTKRKLKDRVFNKASACLFCENLYTNMSKHYLRSHKNEKEVIHIKALKENGKLGESKREWELLRNRGNHRHNKEVIKSKTGELLVVRRKAEENFCSEDYTPCPKCLGWYLKSAIYVHVNYRCILKESNSMRSSSILMKSQLHRSEKDTNILDEVFLSMRNDSITELCKSDDIIQQVGEFHYKKQQRNKLRCKNFASKHMRSAANLLMKIRELDKTDNHFDYYLKPDKFDLFPRAAIALAGNDDGQYNDLKHPSTLKNIGYLIKQLAEIKEETGITTSSSGKISEAKYFLKLYRRRWTLLASSAQKQLEERTFNQEIHLPTCGELISITSQIVYLF